LLGPTSELTDSGANTTDGYTYDVFGAIRSQSGSSDTMFRFTGEQRDARQTVTKTS